LSKHRKAVYVGRKTRVPEAACLGCGKVMDAASGLGTKRKPKPGNIGVCLYCGHLQAYGWDLKFRPLTDEEMLEIAGDERIVAANTARAKMFRAP
jgi:hypothetical protein